MDAGMGLRFRAAEKTPIVAQAVRLLPDMKVSKALQAVFISAAIGWTGFSTAHLLLSKLQDGLPNARQAAVVAIAAASVANDMAEIAAKAGLPEPVGAGPADAETEPESVAATAGGVEFEDAELLVAFQQGILQATLRGNGRERMSAQLRNNSPTPLRVEVPAGQVLESGRNRVVVTRTVSAELMPARMQELSLSTAALHSSNVIGEGPYRFSYHSADRVDGFLKWASERGEISAPAMQTAILALTENLPLSAFAKFASANGTGSPHHTDAFRVETSDLLAALTALRESGAKLDSIIMTADPQLRIEAMIEPLSREAAKRYYGISEEREWDFWKHELLEGNPSTRHYALFGIARFYPDVAIEMLPKWAREAQTHPVFREAAVQALADTQRAEALPILRQIAEEVGAGTDLGKAAKQAADYLDKRLTTLASRSQVVAFRGKSRVSGL